MLFCAFPERVMPIYEYRCGSCGHQQEFLQKVSDALLTTCPQCGKPSLSKLLSAAGFQLKGSGWYATDFKNSGSKSAAKTGGDAKPAADSKSADSKSADSNSADSGSGDSKGGESKSEEKKAAPSCGAGGCAAC
jgi:putative FmdB family regulatory protein